MRDCQNSQNQQDSYITYQVYTQKNEWQRRILQVRLQDLDKSQISLSKIVKGFLELELNLKPFFQSEKTMISIHQKILLWHAPLEEQKGRANLLEASHIYAFVCHQIVHCCASPWRLKHLPA